jgi:hypothetical protein
MQKRSKKSARTNAKRNGARGGLIPHPPPLGQYEVIHNRTLRFLANQNINQNFTYQNLLDTILFTTTATVPYDLFYMVKINRVKAWAMAVIGSAESIQVCFDGTTPGSQGDRILHTASSMGLEPAFLSCAPRPKTLASTFQVASANNAFNMVCPTGTVIDVSLSFKGDSFGTGVAAQNVSVGANVGVIAYRGLDGVAQATTKLGPPLGLYAV